MITDTPSKLGVVVTALTPVFSDERGDIFDIVEESVGHTGLVTCKAGSVRGNHYHYRSVQYNYVLEGTFKLTVASKNGDHVEEYTLTPGSFVRIPVEVIHTYEAVTDGRILDMNTLSRSGDGYERDTVRVAR